MSDAKPWESGWDLSEPRSPDEAPPTRTPDGKFLRGISGNPAGKPKGSLDRRTKLQRYFQQEGEAVARVVMDKALGGDLQACGLVLARMSPPLRAQSERVTFDLDPNSTLAQQAQQIVTAVARGELDPDAGKMLIDCLHSAAGLRQLDEVLERLAKLEGRTGGSHAYSGIVELHS